MFGHNPIRPPEKGDGSLLQVQEIFPTCQGEGPRTGEPSVFIRLGGCNLACTFCDTEFESFHAMTLEAIMEEVQKSGPLPPCGGAHGSGASQTCEEAWWGVKSNHLTPHRSASPTTKQRGGIASLAPPQGGSGSVKPLIVLTGGEPFRQPIAPLCEALLAEGYRIQIETNGTLYRPIPEEVEIVCSPKVTGGSYHPVRPDLLARLTALKFIVSAHREEYGGIPDVGQGGFSIPVYVQPMDEYDPERNTTNRARAEALAEQEGVHLSLQMHKEWGIP